MWVMLCMSPWQAIMVISYDNAVGLTSILDRGQVFSQDHITEWLMMQMMYAGACCSEGLVRTAFQSLQLIVTDFLPTMPCTCLTICVDVTAKFGLQCQDLNISLTAIGLLVC